MSVAGKFKGAACADLLILHLGSTIFVFNDFRLQQFLSSKINNFPDWFLFRVIGFFSE